MFGKHTRESLEHIYSLIRYMSDEIHPLRMEHSRPQPFVRLSPSNKDWKPTSEKGLNGYSLFWVKFSKIVVDASNGNIISYPDEYWHQLYNAEVDHYTEFLSGWVEFDAGWYKVRFEDVEESVKYDSDFEASVDRDIDEWEYVE